MFTQVETCQRIVERHGGRISVAETPGGGAAISFTRAVAVVPEEPTN